MSPSRYLSGFDADQRFKMEQELLSRQTGRCIACDDLIELMLHKGQLDFDHMDPLIDECVDVESNVTLVHASCNQSKGAANLQFARRLAESERLQDDGQENGERGATFADVVSPHDGASGMLRLRRVRDLVEFSLAAAGADGLRKVPILQLTAGKE